MICPACDRALTIESDLRVEIEPRTRDYPGYEQVGCVTCLPDGARLPADGPSRDEYLADVALSDPHAGGGR